MPTTKTPNTTGQALLGLLSIRSWTAYELTQQMRRALRWAWPRSEANLYNEIKRLVPLGLAVAVEEEVGGRTRARYEITDDGRAAVAAWLGTRPPAPPQVQAEALLRLFVADQGTPDDLRATIADTRHQIIEVMQDAILILEEYSSEHPPFPDRAHLNVLFIHFFVDYLHLVLKWCDEAEAEVDTWPGTTAGVGLTDGTQQMLEAGLARYRATVESYHRSERSS
jgi:PadR family transcriptional regulator, regulatory protein AphA